jgi:hypothetical protein
VRLVYYLIIPSIRNKIYAIDVTDRNVTQSQMIKIQGSVCATHLHLRGLVYHSDYHFTCQIIVQSENIWFHDGMTTGQAAIKEGEVRKY